MQIPNPKDFNKFFIVNSESNFNEMKKFNKNY